MTASGFHTETGRPARRLPKRRAIDRKEKGKRQRGSKKSGQRAAHQVENDLLKGVRELRLRLQLGQLDYDRALIHLRVEGHTQEQLAKALLLKQPSVSSALKTAAKTPSPREGFSGADPYEVCQRYAVGELTRKQLISELTRWEYADTGNEDTEFFDDLRFSVPGSFDDVVRALDDGLLEDDVYDAVLGALAGEP